MGFIGFGEVASIFAKPLREKGVEVAAYDILLSAAGKGREMLEERAGYAGVRLCSLPETLAGSQYILSTVTTQVAQKVAQECAVHLRPGQFYLDLNSSSPAAKVAVARIIEPTGADFVEGAILGAVGATGAKTHILVGGPKGGEIAETFSGLGLHFSFYSLEIGRASVFKMLRSVFSKGLEALVIELLVAGKRAGIDKDLWQDIMDLMTKNTFDRIAANWVQTHAVAHERRFHEMEQVVGTMREIGIEPIMTGGTVAFFRRSGELGLAEAFPAKPDSMDAVIEFMEKRLRPEA